MGERQAIESSDRPVTRRSIVGDLERLGIVPGMTLMVHASLSRLGWVVGGPETVVDALLDALGSDGTLMMPTHSSQLTDPSAWENPPVPAAWCDEICTEMPAYDPARTPTREMGAVVEHFRHRAGVMRSDHPTVSAAAIGPNTRSLLDCHAIDRGMGEGSPQARLYDLDGHILLLGVGHLNNTSLHLAEHRAVPAGHRLLAQRSPMMLDGVRRWVDHDAIDEDNDFEAIGAAFAETGLERSGPVGAGTGRLMRSRDLVDSATDWLRSNAYGAAG